MTHELTTLPSGVRVVTETLPEVRSVALGSWVDVGSRDEHLAEAGCSHFLEHLLFKGTATRSARDIAETFDAIGGELNAFTARELTCFHARVLDTDLPVAFEVLADLLVDATNAPADVEAERQVVLSELDVLADSPEDLVHADLDEAMWGEHPLARETLGTLASVAGLDREVIDGFYREQYRPGALVVAAAGNLTHDHVVALTDAQLGDLGRPGAGVRPPRRAPRAAGAGAVRVRHRPTEQAHVALGMPGLAQDDDDRVALEVLTTLLGGGMSSRLFQQIREVRGLAYTTYADASSYTDAGTLVVYVGTAPGKVDETLAVLRGELDRVATDVTGAEVERAKGALAGASVLGAEDTGARMVRLGKRVVTGAELLELDEALARLAAVELADVRRVAERVLDGPRSLAVVGPFDEHDPDRFGHAVS